MFRTPRQKKVVSLVLFFLGVTLGYLGVSHGFEGWITSLGIVWALLVLSWGYYLDEEAKVAREQRRHMLTEMARWQR